MANGKKDQACFADIEVSETLVVESSHFNLLNLVFLTLSMYPYTECWVRVQASKHHEKSYVCSSTHDYFQHCWKDVCSYLCFYIMMIGYRQSCFSIWLFHPDRSISQRSHRQEVAIPRPPVDFGDGSWAFWKTRHSWRCRGKVGLDKIEATWDPYGCYLESNIEIPRFWDNPGIRE